MPVRFEKQWIASQPYESAGIIDVNGDGILDIVSGAWWYQGPDFRKKHPIWDPPALYQYHDDFSTIFLDATGNGFPDIVTGGFFGAKLLLLVNPGLEEKPWEVREIARPGNIETTRAWDLDGDGDLEIVPNLPGGPLLIYKLIRDDQGKPTGKFAEHRIWEGPQGHGLGFGNISGSGRGDLTFAQGWLEAPLDRWTGKWIFHQEWEMERPSIPMLVADIDGDGKTEIIAGGAHHYGLDWWKRQEAGPGQTWIRHPIDPFNSQYHDLIWADVDGDGVMEFITGKRYYAHNGTDPGEDDQVGLYYFKWTGEGFSKQIIDYGPPGIGKGCGIHFAVGDLNGNGRPDIVAPGKDGLCIFWNRG